MNRIVLGVALVMTAGVVQVAAETRTLSFRDFDAIGVGNGMRVAIAQGSAYRVEATGDARDLQQLDVKQNGTRLEFSMQRGWRTWVAGPINLSITLPALRSLGLSGGAQGNLEHKTGSNPFALALSGGASLNGRLDCGDITVALSGGSRVGLSGTGGRLQLDASGGSRYLSKDFVARDVTANLSGGSIAAVNLRGRLDGALSGGSDVTHYGPGVLGSIQSSGGSRIHQGS